MAMKFSKLVIIPILFLYIGTTFLTYQYYMYTARTIDRELHGRISTMAKAVKISLESLSGSGSMFDPENEEVADKLAGLEHMFSLENINLLDMFHQVVNTTNPVLVPEEGGYAAISEAEKKMLNRGEVIIRPLFSLEGSRFKTVIIPLAGDAEPGAVMMDINLSYLDVLHKFKRRFIYGSAASGFLFVCVLLLMLYIMKRLERARLERQANEKLALIGKMSASIAHEIKNPLGIIKSSAQVIEKKYGEKEDETFSFIYEEIDRLNQNINDYLTFARDITVKPEVINLEDNINRILRDFPEVHFESGNVGSVSFDPFRLTQLIRNLVLNAQKYGGGRIAVKTGKNRDGAYIQVSDEGPGIPEEQLQAVFEAFNTSSRSGTGLGLNICKKIAELHGGRITVENLHPKGTRFTVTMPLK
jgi:signal transduction histidine kinase